jgi:hypothetical protein
MRRFQCPCSSELYFDNHRCCACGRTIGYDPERGNLFALEPWRDRWQSTEDKAPYRLCRNRTEHGVCNGLVPDGHPGDLCLVCRLNRTIPDLNRPENLQRWAKLELAKRRLIFGLLALGLPLEAPVAGHPRGLCFDFLEDSRTDPSAGREFVTTSHSEGVITLNVLEADDVQRAWQRELSSERYRTLLGHFRHEAGHYYYELLVRDQAQFARLFGDPNIPYDAALQGYYARGALAGWEHNHISAYASSHPLEDWAESFAHYLHMADVMETARLRGMIPPSPDSGSIDEMLKIWDGLAVTLNELNRGLGLNDAYPFVVTPTVAEKLHFVHAMIRQ